MKPKIVVVENPIVEAAHCNLVVCQTVKDLPTQSQDSKIVQCDDCGDDIWLAPTTPRQPPRVCIRCAKVRIGAEDGHVIPVISAKTNPDDDDSKTMKMLREVMGAAKKPQ